MELLCNYGFSLSFSLSPFFFLLISYSHFSEIFCFVLILKPNPDYHFFSDASFSTYDMGTPTAASIIENNKLL